MPLYDVWWKVGGSTKPIDKQWRIVGRVELPYPYWGAKAVTDGDPTLFGKVFWSMKEAIGRSDGAARRAFAGVPVYTLRMRMEVEPVTVIHASGSSGPRRYVQHWAITPPYNVIYDLRNDPHGAEHGAEALPFVWSLPGLVADRGYVVQGGTPWPAPVEVPVNVEGKNLDNFRVAIDEALEKGLAGTPIGNIGYKVLGSELSVMDIRETWLERNEQWQMENRYAERPSDMTVESLHFVAYRNNGNWEPSERWLQILVSFYDERGKLRLEHRVGRVEEALQGQIRVVLEAHGTNYLLTAELSDRAKQGLSVWLDGQMEQGHFGEVKGQEAGQRYAFITFKKVRHEPDPEFRRKYGARTYHAKLTFKFIRNTTNPDGSWRSTFYVDNLGWYPSHLLAARLAQLARGEKVQLVNNSMMYQLQPEDLPQFSVWLDQVMEMGFLT